VTKEQSGKGTMTITEKIKEKLPGHLLDSGGFRGDETVTLRKEALIDAANYLKHGLKFEFLMDLTCVDYLGVKEPRFEMVYHFYSFENNLRLRVKVPLSLEESAVDSLSSLWLSADWYEREVYDMFGINFNGHPDLRRILMYDGFAGHPLRKDYPLKKRQPRIAESVKSKT